MFFVLISSSSLCLSLCLPAAHSLYLLLIMPLAALHFISCIWLHDCLLDSFLTSFAHWLCILIKCDLPQTNFCTVDLNEHCTLHGLYRYHYYCYYSYLHCNSLMSIGIGCGGSQSEFIALFMRCGCGITIVWTDHAELHIISLIKFVSAVLIYA